MFGFGKPKKPVVPLLFTVQLNGDGTRYESFKKKGVTREALLNKTAIGDPVQFQLGSYEDKPVYYVLNKKGLDICCVPLPLSEYIVNMVEEPVLTGNLVFWNSALPNARPMLLINVGGKWKSEYPLASAGRYTKEYKYRLDNPDEEYFMLPPGVELECELIEFEEGYKVMMGEALLGLITDKRKEGLKRMLGKYKCHTTVVNELHEYQSTLLMWLRF